MTLPQGTPSTQEQTQQENKINGLKKDKTSSKERLEAFAKMGKKSQERTEQSQTGHQEGELPEQPKEIELPFQILGYNTERKVLIWHKGHMHLFSISQLREDEFKLFIKFPDEDINYKTRVKDKILQEAREKGLVDVEEPLKMGVWRINDKFLIVTGKTAIEVCEGNLKEIDHPVYNGKIIKFSKSWLNVKKFKEKYGKTTLKDVYEKIYSYVSQWCWKEKDAPEYIAAIIMVIVFQHAMKWRPWVYISGETGSGKTLFLDEVLELLFNELIKNSDKTTAHAIYQAVGNTSRILCLDEFEKSKHIPQVMEALKLMNRGGEKNIGTPGEKELSFIVHHLPILASIYTPATCLKDESQRNRLVQFELSKPKDRTPPAVWTTEEAEEILSELVAAVMHAWDAIQKEVEQITKKTVEIKQSLEGKIDDRTVQNFMYFSAILKLVTGKDYTVPAWAKTEKKSDGQSIIEAIIFSKIRHGNIDYLVADLIDATLRRPGHNELDANEAKNALRLHGLTVVERAGWYLAIHAENTSKHLLRNSEEYKNLDITLPLERLSGSEKKKAAFGENSSLAAIQIPMCLVDELRGIAV